MPEGLEIDQKRQIYGLVAPDLLDHLLLHTGTADWPSKIEDDERYPFLKTFKASMKELAIKAGPREPFNLLLSASSLGPLGSGSQGAVISAMRAGLHVIADEEPDHLQKLATALAECAAEEGAWTRDRLKKQFRTRPVEEVVVLICGHGNRDMRCGVMGPLLESEFKDKLSRMGFKEPGASTQDGQSLSQSKLAQVGLVSHIGGHVFAGNVIIYVPAAKDFESNPLAGRGVWYGRVEPKHVEGIVQKTILEGVVIEEILRGVV
jgi:hypothetical protein